MDKQPSIPFSLASHAKKIYVILIGCAPMASLDALMFSLDRFKNILSSDSAKERFETTLRTIKSSLNEVHQFIDQVYLEKNPTKSVTMTGRTLIIEIALDKENFLALIDEGKVDTILAHVKAVGTMPAKKMGTQTLREYTVHAVKYENGKFLRSDGR